jgi:hypothetical protein
MQMTNKLAAGLITFLIGSLPFVAIAGDSLHTYPESGIAINKTEHVKTLHVEGDYITFKLSKKEIFATAMVHKDTLSNYPMLDKFSGRFFEALYGAQDHEVFEKLNVEKTYANNSSQGIEYLIDVADKNCELFLTSVVGGNTYMVFTISNEVNKGNCVDKGQSLRTQLDHVVNSISLSAL